MHHSIFHQLLHGQNTYALCMFILTTIWGFQESKRQIWHEALDNNNDLTSEMQHHWKIGFSVYIQYCICGLLSYKDYHKEKTSSFSCSPILALTTNRCW